MQLCGVLQASLPCTSARCRASCCFLVAEGRMQVCISRAAYVRLQASCPVPQMVQHAALRTALLLGRQVEDLPPWPSTHPLLLMQLVVPRHLHGFAPQHVPMLPAGDAHPCSLECAPHGVVGDAVVAHPDVQVPAGGRGLAVWDQVLCEVEAHGSWRCRCRVVRRADLCRGQR